jgi:hypothetical protein
VWCGVVLSASMVEGVAALRTVVTLLGRDSASDLKLCVAGGWLVAGLYEDGRPWWHRRLVVVASGRVVVSTDNKLMVVGGANLLAPI